jgi:hypothetical protein
MYPDANARRQSRLATLDRNDVARYLMIDEAKLL